MMEISLLVVCIFACSVVAHAFLPTTQQTSKWCSTCSRRVLRQHDRHPTPLNIRTVSTGDNYKSKTTICSSINYEDEIESIGSNININNTFQYEGRINSNNNPNYRCGFVCILGAPNMGKSTILNSLLKEDLCIATARPQTTRHAILGILSTSNCQVCLIDTPGIIETPAYKLQENMMEAVIGAYHDADILLIVTDVFSTPIQNDILFQKVQQSKKPKIVIINKIDLPEKVKSVDDKKSITKEEAVQTWRQLLPDAFAIIPVCANNGSDDPGIIVLRKLLTGGPDLSSSIRDLGRPIPGMFQSGVQLLNDNDVKQLLPLSPPLYDNEILTDRTERFVASEIIRSVLFQSLKKELPYCCEVQIRDYKEPKRNDKKQVIRIVADVIVERDSQKIIVIGKNGEQIKEIGTNARYKLEEFLQCQVFLNLSVKVDKDWRKKDDKLKAYGYTT